MEWVTLLLLFALGALGAANIIVAKKPEAEELIDKLKPFQGWIGVVGVFWGIWWFINLFRLGVFSWFKVAPVAAITYLLSIVVFLGLGLLMGLGVMKTFIKNEETVKKLEETVEKLRPWQGRLGLASLAIAIVWLLEQIVGPF